MCEDEALWLVLASAVSRPSGFFYEPFDRFGTDAFRGLLRQGLHDFFYVFGRLAERSVDVLWLFVIEQRATPATGLIV